MQSATDRQATDVPGARNTMICTNCPLGGPQCFGDGPPKADLVIVGEAPGRQEVQAGKPFIGPAGNLLDATLREFGILRSDVYVTNTVACRPTDKEGKDAPPSKQMLEACHGRLMDEISTRDPKLVIAVGATAASTLCETADKITNIQGSLFLNSQLKKYVLPTYHPAAVLHGNTGYFDSIYLAFQRAALMVRGELPFPNLSFRLQWEFIEDPIRAVRALEWFYGHVVIAADTESKTTSTVAPRPAMDEWIMLQLYAPTHAVAFNMRELLKYQTFRDALRKLFSMSGKKFIWHNAAHDLQVLRANDMPYEHDFLDTMVLGLGLTERGEQTGLEFLSYTYLNAPNWKAQFNQSGYKWHIGPQNRNDWLRLAEYGCYDVYYTYELNKILPKLVRDEGTMELCKGLLLSAQRAFANVEYVGTNIDLEYAQALEAEWLPIIEKAEKELQGWSADRGYPQDTSFVSAQTKPIPCPECHPLATQLGIRWDGTGNRLLWRGALAKSPFGDPSCKRCMKRRYVLVPDHTLNVRSYIQLQHLAFDILRMRHPEGRRSTEEAFLAYNEHTPFVKLLRAIREKDHLLRSYIRGISDDVWSDGRLHPDFLLYGTVTGRLAIHNPPLQTIPKWGVDPENAKLIRRMFRATPGYVIVDVDYKNLELFIAWHYSGDETLGFALTQRDFHTFTAAGAFQKPYDQVTGLDRFNSKFITFGIAYGRQEWSLAQGELFELTGGDPAEARKYIDNFWNTYPGYKEVYDRWQYDAIEKGELRTPMGRVRRWRLITGGLVNHIKNQAVNFPIQSLASDTCLSALIRLNAKLPAMELGRVLFTVHDSVVFEVPENRLDEAVTVIAQEMVKPPFETHIKLFVDIEVGETLGDVKHYQLQGG
jgi:uracil-DNA glycosylase family 4